MRDQAEWKVHNSFFSSLSRVKKGYFIILVLSLLIPILFYMESLFFQSQKGYIPPMIYGILVAGLIKYIPRLDSGDLEKDVLSLDIFKVYFILFALTFILLVVINAILTHFQNLTWIIITEANCIFVAMIIGLCFVFFVLVDREPYYVEKVISFVLPFIIMDTLMRLDIYRGVGMYYISGLIFVIGLIALGFFFCRYRYIKITEEVRTDYWGGL